jgi:hypothetical protein
MGCPRVNRKRWALRFFCKKCLLHLLVLSVGSIKAQSTSNSDTTVHELNSDKNAPNIRNTLTPLLISRFGGGAGALAQRVSAVSVSGGYASVRGLSPRYTSYMYDDLSAGVTEQNIKTFSLQFIPGGVLNDLIIDKSGVASNPGEFAGAVINSHSRSALPKDVDLLSFGVAYRANTTFEDFYIDPDYQHNAKSFFGFSDKNRGFFDDVAGYKEIQAMTRNERAEEAKKLENNYYFNKTTAPPDFSLGYTLGRNIKMKKPGTTLSTVNLISFGKAYVNGYWNRFSYANYIKGPDNIVESTTTTKAYSDVVSSLPSQLAIMSNWELNKNGKNKIVFSNLFSQIGVETTVLRYFLEYDKQREVIASSVGQTAQSSYLARLKGEHKLTDNSNLEWAAGYNLGYRNEPDLRRFGGTRSYKDSGAQFLYVVPDGSKADNGARFGSQQRDNTLSGRADYNITTENRFNLSFGVLGEYSHRDFKSRLLTFAKDGFTRQELLFVPFTKDNIRTIFGPQNFGPDGYFLVDGTTDADNYVSHYTLLSAYAQASKTLFNNLLVNLGVRVEDFKQNLASDTTVDNNSTDVLPFVNLKYNLGNDMDLRFGFSKSVNRPAFRELAPFSFYDYDFRADIQGNPTLKNAEITNLDAKWECFIGSSDYLSFGGFYKHFKNPIEMYYIIRSELPLFTFQNSEKAEVAGLEFELKKTLSPFSNSILHDMAIYLNAAYIKSNIELGSNSFEAASNRPLQGQAPYVINFSYIYSNDKKGVKAEILYNVTGTRLYSTGDGQETYPWYLMPRNMIDINISKSISKNWTMSIGISNLLDAPIELREDGNLDGKVSSVGGADNVIQKGYQGQRVSLGFNWRIR